MADTKLNELIINEMTAEQATTNIDALNEKELIILDDISMPIPTADNVGQGLKYGENGFEFDTFATAETLNNYVPKKTAKDGEVKAYVISGSNGEDVCQISMTGEAGSITRYNYQGQVCVTVDPTDQNHTTRKKYVDTLCDGKVDKVTEVTSDDTGTTSRYIINDPNADGITLGMYMTSGTEETAQMAGMYVLSETVSIVGGNNILSVDGGNEIINVLCGDSSILMQSDNTDISSKAINLNGNVTIDGNITQNGSTYETHAEQVYTKNDIVITRDGATGALGASEYTGIRAKLYDGTNDGLLVFGADGVARVGDEGDTQPLATREESPTFGACAYWDTTTKSFKTSMNVSPWYISVGNGVKVGMNAYSDSSNYAISIGASSSSSGNDAIAIGHNTSVNGEENIAIGGNISVSTTASFTKGTIVIGDSSIGTGLYATSIGRTARAMGQGALALGSNAKVGYQTPDSSEWSNVNAGTAVGYNSTVSANNAVALGAKANANGKYSIQLGAGTNDVANTLSVGLEADTNYLLLKADGTIPAERLVNTPLNIEVTIDQPSTATNGTLSDEQLATLQANKSNYITFNGEKYNFADDHTAEGFLVYSHSGLDATYKFYVKCIAITLSTKGWALRTLPLIAYDEETDTFTI